MSNDTPSTDPYKVLGLPKDATESAIRGSYKKLMLQCHPDKVHDESLREEKAKMFEEVQQAYELLSDPRRRKKYDMEASGQKPSPPAGYRHPSYEQPRNRSRSFEEKQAAEDKAASERRRMDREQRMRIFEQENRRLAEEARKREYEARMAQQEAARYAHARQADPYSRSPPKEYPVPSNDTPKTAYEEQLEEEEEKKREARKKRAQPDGHQAMPVLEEEYVPGKFKMPTAAPIQPGMPLPAYDMHARPMHPSMAREHYGIPREAHERAEQPRRSEDHMRPHRESTKSRERMAQEAAERERIRNEAEMAEMIGKPRERRSSNKEARPHISSEDLGEKRERSRKHSDSVPVDIPGPHYRPENPPLRASVSPSDPRAPGPRYGGSAPGPVPAGVPTSMPYGSPQRRHSTSGPNPPHLYTEPGTYGEPGFAPPGVPHPHPHPHSYSHLPEDDNVSSIGDLPNLGAKTSGRTVYGRGYNGAFNMSMPTTSPISPGYGSGQSPMAAHTPHHPSGLNPGYSQPGYAPSTVGQQPSSSRRYDHSQHPQPPQVRRSSTVPSPSSVVGGDAPPISSRRPSGKSYREGGSQVGSRYGSGRGNTQEREEVLRRSRPSAYGPAPESPLRSRDPYISHMHHGAHPGMTRANTVGAATDY